VLWRRRFIIFFMIHDVAKNCAELILTIKQINIESASNLAIIEEQKIKIVVNQSDVFLCGENCESHLAA